MKIVKKCALSFRIGMFFTVASFMYLHAEGTKTLVGGDGKTNRVNLVFMAEGYSHHITG